MNKLSNLIFVRREGLEQKWWHRLAKVLIWGSTVVVTVFAFLLFFLGNSFVSHSYSAYSFQSNFASARGKIENCIFQVPGITDNNLDTSNFLSLIHCGNLTTPQDFLSEYIKNQGEYRGITNVPPVFINPSFDFTTGQVNFNDDNFTNINKAVNLGIISGDFSNIQTKRVTHFLLGKLVVSILEFVGIILGWFVLLESIIYRTIIYIIYGKTKK